MAILGTVLVTIALYTLSFAARASIKVLPNKVSPGIYAHRTDGPLIYESYAALTFELSLPEVNASTAFEYSCPNDRLATNYSCPIYHHLRKLWDEVGPFIQLQHLRHPSASQSEGYIPSCSEIARHFSAQTITPESLRKYKQLLRDCVQGIQATSIVKRPDDTNIYSGQQLIKSFIENYYTVLPSNKRVDKAILVNILAVADGLKMTQLLQEAQAWTDAVTQCRNGLVPTSRISSAVFQNVLSVLQRRLGDKQLVIDPETDLSSYFTLPITDCVLTTNDRLFVRVLVPLKSNGTNWSLNSLTSVPFVYNDGEDGSPLLCTAKDGSVISGKAYSYESNSSLSFPMSCDTKTQALCHNGESESSIESFKRTCGSEILAGNQAQILKLCELHCEPIDSFRTPITVRVAPDTFYIAGKVNEVVKVVCGNKTEKLALPKEGALEVHVPCECNLVSGGKVLTVLKPCERNMTVYNVKPMHLAGAGNTFATEEVDESESDSRKYPRL